MVSLQRSLFGCPYNANTLLLREPLLYRHLCISCLLVMYAECNKLLLLTLLLILICYLLFVQGEHFNVTLCKGPRGFGFSLVAAPTFSSDVSQVTSSATATESLIFFIQKPIYNVLVMSVKYCTQPGLYRGAVGVFMYPFSLLAKTKFRFYIPLCYLS